MVEGGRGGGRKGADQWFIEGRSTDEEWAGGKMGRLMDQIGERELHFNGSSAYVKASRGFHEGKNPRR